MTIHFEDLWNKSEEFHAKSNLDKSSISIIDEIFLKIKLYKSFEEKTDLPIEEKKKIKERIFGEILLTLTNLSLKDDINTFLALNSALQYRMTEFYSQK